MTGEGEAKMKKDIEMKKGDKIYVLGTGNQAPYGIDEIIDIIPAAHIRKIAAICRQYYSPPSLRLNDRFGEMIELDYDYNNHISGYVRS